MRQLTQNCHRGIWTAYYAGFWRGLSKSRKHNSYYASPTSKLVIIWPRIKIVASFDSEITKLAKSWKLCDGFVVESEPGEALVWRHVMRNPQTKFSVELGRGNSELRTPSSAEPPSYRALQSTYVGKTCSWCLWLFLCVGEVWIYFRI